MQVSVSDQIPQKNLTKWAASVYIVYIIFFNLVYFLSVDFGIDFRYAESLAGD